MAAKTSKEDKDKDNNMVCVLILCWANARTHSITHRRRRPRRNFPRRFFLFGADIQLSSFTRYPQAYGLAVQRGNVEEVKRLHKAGAYMLVRVRIIHFKKSARASLYTKEESPNFNS